MAKCSRSVKVYLDRMFGMPQQIFTFPAAPEVAVVKWDSEHTGDDIAFYVTIGASDWYLESSPDHRQEYFVGLDPDQDGIAIALASVGIGPFRTGLPVKPETAIDAGRLWPGTEMDGFLVTGPDEDVMPTLTTKRAHVSFVQVVPTFAVEREYYESRGEDALLAAWERLDVPYWDPTRVASALP